MRDFEITEKMAQSAAQVCWAWFEKRVNEKGSRSFSCMVETYGVILEEYSELMEAVRQNDHAKVRHEILDIFVPCLFDLPILEERIEKAGPSVGFRMRLEVDQSKARQTMKCLEKDLLGEHLFSSIHDIVGHVGIDIGYLERTFSEEIRKPHHYGNYITNLAITCLRAIASLDSTGFMDW